MPLSPRRIQALPEVVINQIAAGEVVERPASVVKELVENSLDAGADEVLVDVEDGGCRLIRVRDNGLGIVAEDLPLALSRHATSKIGGFDDLLSLSSLGFRGEALPSIGSISTLVLSSRIRGAECGWRVQTRGGTGTTAPIPTPHPPGTSVEVRDLFFNTPARRKFLRSERTELLQIEDAIKRVALSRVEVRFALRHNRRNVLNLRKGTGPLDIGERLRQMGGAPLACAVAVDETAGSMRLSGWIWPAPLSGGGQEIKYLYVNGRAVRDRALQHALWTAAEHSDCAGRFAAFLLYLDLDPVDVDVNVHPQKLEVRFRDGRSVHDFVLSAVKRAVAGGGHPLPVGYPAEALAPARTRSAAGVREARPAYSPASQRPVPRSVGPGSRRIVALVAGRYLIATDPAGVTVIDGEEAFRRLFAAWATGAPAITRSLLLPERLALDAADLETLERHATLLARMGLDLEPIGRGGLSLRGLPRALGRAGYEDLIRAVLTALRGQTAGPGSQEALLAVLTTYALCSAAASTPEALAGMLGDLEAAGYGRGGSAEPGLRRLGPGDLERLVRGDAEIDPVRSPPRLP